MTPKECADACEAIHKITLATCQISGPTIVLMGLSQLAAAGVLIWLLATLF
jgi:hypothetical protein